MQAILSGVMTIFFYAMVIALVWKVFQISTDLGEIKALMTQMRNATPAPVPAPAKATPSPPVLAGPISLESAEALLREVAAESHAIGSTERPKTTA
jgi:hypothetical protein